MQELDQNSNLENLPVESTEGSNEQSRKRFVGSRFFLLSALLHTIVVLLLILVKFSIEDKKPDIIITTSVIPMEEEEKIETQKVELVKNLQEVNTEVVTTEAVQVSVTEEVSETTETDNQNDSAFDSAEGLQDAVSDSPLVGSGLLGNIGGGGGGGGNFGQRNGSGKKRAILKNGGSVKTESAVDNALMWLAKHQEPDGHWDTAKHEGEGTGEVVSAASGSALLAFLGAGHTDKAGKYKGNVKNAIQWLIKNQKPNGSWDARNYTNGICTMALAEAAGMGCGGPEVKKAAALATEYILGQQNGCGGFTYTGPYPKGADMSVTGWCIMALKSALLAGIKEKEVKEAFKKCGDLLDREEGTKDNTSTTKGLAWYSVLGDKQTVGSGIPGGACQSIAMLVRQYLGWNRHEFWLTAAADGQTNHIPQSYKGMNVYRVYYAYLTLFQQGGKHWQAWNEPVSNIILKAQRQDGDFKGSWDLNGSPCNPGGRVMYTAFLCLSLEIYYRYASVSK